MNSEKWSKGSELRALLKTSSCRGKGRLLSSAAAAATEVLLLTSDALLATQFCFNSPGIPNSKVNGLSNSAANQIPKVATIIKPVIFLGSS